MKITNNKKSTNKTLFFIVGFIFIAACVYLTIESATTGAEIARLVEMQDKITLEKKDLTARLVENSSLNVMSEKALSLGFQEPQKVVYIQKSDEFASLLP